jgi:predicted RNA-binding Zn ribbon-like protein
MVKEDFLWVGGALWLDFINTEVIANGQRVDLLADDGALLDWLNASGSVPPEVVRSLTILPVSERGLLLEKTKQLRGILRSLCEGLEKNGQLSSGLLEQINTFLRAPAPGLKLERKGDGGFDLVTEWSQTDSHQLLFAIARDAAETLSGHDLSRLRPCASDQCILWFLDTSKNGQRRWCSMEICGNRHKVSQHNLRKKTV